MRTASSLVAALVLSLERDGVVCLYREDQARDQGGRFAEEGATGGGGAERRRSDPDAAVRAASAIEHGKNATFADLERALGRAPTGRERSIFRNVIKARGGRVVAEAPAEEAPAEAVTSPQDAPAPPEAPEAAPTPAEPPAPEPTAATAVPDLAIDPGAVPGDLVNKYGQRTGIGKQFERRGLQADQVVHELPASVASLVDEVERAHDHAKAILRERFLAQNPPPDSPVGVVQKRGLDAAEFDRAFADFEAQGGRLVPDRMRVALVAAEAGGTMPSASDLRRSVNAHYDADGVPSVEDVPQLKFVGVPPWPSTRTRTDVDRLAGWKAEGTVNPHPITLWLNGEPPPSDRATDDWLAGGLLDSPDRLQGWRIGRSPMRPDFLHVDPRAPRFAWTSVRLPGAVPLVAPKAEAVLAAEPKGPVVPAWDPVELANPAGRREVVSKWEQGKGERDVLGMLAARLRAGETLSSEERALAGRMGDRLVEHARVYTDRVLARLDEEGLTAGMGWGPSTYRSGGDLGRPYPIGPDRPSGADAALLTFQGEGRSLVGIGRMEPFAGSTLKGINQDPALLRAIGLTTAAERMERVFDDARARWAERGDEIGLARRVLEARDPAGRSISRTAEERRAIVQAQIDADRATRARFPEIQAAARAYLASQQKGSGFGASVHVDHAKLARNTLYENSGASDYERAAAAQRAAADEERAAYSASLERAKEIAEPKSEWPVTIRAVDAFERLQRDREAGARAAASVAPKGVKDPPEVARSRANLAGASSMSERGVELPMKELADFAKQASAKIGHKEGDHAVFDLPGGAAYALPIPSLRKAIETIRRLPDAQAFIAPSGPGGEPRLTFRWRNPSQPKGVLSGRLELLPRHHEPGSGAERIASVRVGEPGAVTASAEIPDREWWLDALALARDGLLDDRALHVPRSASYVPDAVHVPTLVQLSADRLAQAVPLPLSSVQGDDGPKWVQLAYAGTWKGHAAAKSFSFDREAFEKMVENFRADPRFDGGNSDVVAFDFNHASEMHPSQLSDKGAPAQAWLQDVEVRNGPGGEPQLWGKVRYLPLARQYVRGGQYRYLSIAFTPDGRHLVSGKRIGPQIKSVAFTNDPFLRGLAPLVASADSPPVPTRDDEADMSTTIARLISVFALAATATEDDVIRAAEANVKELKDRRDVEAKQAVAVVCSAYGFDAERDAPTLLAAYTSDPEAFAKRYPVEGTRAAKRKLAPVVALEQRVVSGASRRAAPVTALGAGAAEEDEDERDEDDLPAGFKLSAYPGRNATERCLAAVDADPAWKGRPYDERFERARALKRAAERAGQC